MNWIYLIAVFFLSVWACTSPASQAPEIKLMPQDSPVTRPAPLALLEKPLMDTFLRDTFFLSRDFFDGAYHAIYIEKNRKSRAYDWLFNFDLSKSDMKSIQQAAKQVQTPVSHFDLQGLPHDWLPLYAYHGKYYLYGPSDWGSTNRRSIQDSLILFWYMDGPYPYFLTKVQRKGNVWLLESNDAWNNEDVIAKPEQLEIHLIDEEKQVAVWAYKKAGVSEFRYRLFVAKEKAHAFDMIVNYCDEMKQMEFNGFDDIDYKRLIQRSTEK
jgi:hypothetical protein